jgi:hypothetical protein
MGLQLPELLLVVVGDVPLASLQYAAAVGRKRDARRSFTATVKLIG